MSELSDIVDEPADTAPVKYQSATRLKKVATGVGAAIAFAAIATGTWIAATERPIATPTETAKKKLVEAQKWSAEKWKSAVAGAEKECVAFSAKQLERHEPTLAERVSRSVEESWRYIWSQPPLPKPPTCLEELPGRSAKKLWESLQSLAKK